MADDHTLNHPLDYFPPPTRLCPTFDGDTEWTPLVDGNTYLPELAATLRRCTRGDSVIVVGLELDPDLDLDGRPPGDPARDPLGGVLARIAADGVEVRIVLASRALAASVPGSVFGGFRATAKNAERLRALRVGTQRPLAGRVLLDFSGAFAGSNHQKAVVCRVGGETIGFVGGIDLVTDRFDGGPHDRLRLRGRRWGWHDMAVRVRGRGAEQVWQALRERWTEASDLPRRSYLRTPVNVARLNPERPVGDPGPAEPTAPVAAPGTQVRVLRSVDRRKIAPVLPWHARAWDDTVRRPPTGVHEIFETLTAAIAAARRYVYIEDQYLDEELGGNRRFELFPALRDAAARGVKVVLVGSGVRDPEDAGLHVGAINRRLNPDVRRKIVDRLPREAQDAIALYRVERVTVHSKLVLVDDVFACIGSANMFSRSMAGTDCELSVAVQTDTTLVRDLRVAVWGEHLRAPLTGPVSAALADLDTALGIWRAEWSGADPLLWRAAEHPAGFLPGERMLALVGP
ncbi:phosphatidylserine/phosphatidylglycerophosphate/cardiolipin synthase family protein [Jatrophihabitans endophyticus]|uniref:phospholipase D-like domain-containing protein n=1 Tax=Jatrophihabitans endophyticus TaxID=1206085 RepID=UPI0019F48B82|nr:phospholipase D-like domain-containing protein [Jatrophihabitans endophyticus]MBE7188275.1 phosphatidylserine/phosphatidylglycerophosphate/cardiolipin synthase family protein [Jatrophihabitans endophyticus]